jgi:hypothetical protein
MIINFTPRKSFNVFYLEHSRNEVLCLFTNIARECQRRGFYVKHKVCFRCAVPRIFSKYQSIKQEPCRPDITFGTIFLSGQDLRSHVERSSLVTMVQLLILIELVEKFSKAKVHNLDFSISV